MSTQTAQRPTPARTGILGRLTAALCGLLDRIVDRSADGAPWGAAPRHSEDPWDAGYRAGLRAGYWHAARDEGTDPITYRAPYREGSTAAALWWQGFKIGFCDGAAERR